MLGIRVRYLTSLLLAGAAALTIVRGASAQASDPNDDAPASASTDTLPTLVLPRPTGPFAVGVTTWHLVDRSRPEVATLDPADHRELMVHLRYPIDRVIGTRRAPYFLNPREGRLNAPDPAPTFYDHVIDWTRLDAPLSKAQARWPVVLFSPGLGVPLPFYTNLMEDIASHGYIVVGIVHTYAVGVTVLPGGRIAAEDDAVAHGYFDDFDALNKIWVEDARFVLDRVERLDARPGSEWRGRLDLQRVAMVGQSFGGATAAALARIDPRIRAAANMDGRFFGPVIEEGLDQPFMLFNEDPPFEYPGRASFFQHLRGPGYDLHLAQAGHNNYGDLALMFPLLQHLIPELTPDLFGIGTIDAVRAVDVSRAYLRAFLDQYLRGRRSPLLTGNSPEFPEVSLTRYNPQ